MKAPNLIETGDKMSFQLRFHEDQTTGLVAICDVCGKMVRDSENALVCWDSNKPEIGNLLRYRITCKGQCTRILDQKYGHQFTQQLDVGIGYLMNNCGVDFNKMRRTMKLLNEIG